jgi:uncharacterized protein YutE (UPF0331/DUF86 family)
MIDRVILAAKIGAVRDAVARIQSVLPRDSEAFVADRTAREIVALNLFVAVQECIALAAHWISDEGEQVPASYADLFRDLGERDIVSPPLAARLATASGFRNLVAHQYGVLDWKRVYLLASGYIGDLLAFCDALAKRAG